MFEHYTENAQRALERARYEAQKLRHDHLGTEHILLGLLEVADGIAADVLARHNVNLRQARAEVISLVRHGAGPEDGDYEVLPRTTHAQAAIDDALAEARALKHPHIGTEHLLLGLLHENEGTGAIVIQKLGLKLQEVRNYVLRFVQKDAKKHSV